MIAAVLLIMLGLAWVGWMLYDAGWWDGYMADWREQEPCGSPMCSAPHKNPFGRCACAKPKGHDGKHDCGERIGEPA